MVFKNFQNISHERTLSFIFWNRKHRFANRNDTSLKTLFISTTDRDFNRWFLAFFIKQIKFFSKFDRNHRSSSSDTKIVSRFYMVFNKLIHFSFRLRFAKALWSINIWVTLCRQLIRNRREMLLMSFKRRKTVNVYRILKSIWKFSISAQFSLKESQKIAIFLSKKK